MNWLSSIYNDFKTGAQAAYNTVSSGLSNLFSGSGSSNQSANVSNALDFNNPLNNKLQADRQQAQQLTQQLNQGPTYSSKIGGVVPSSADLARTQIALGQNIGSTKNTAAPTVTANKAVPSSYFSVISNDSGGGPKSNSEVGQPYTNSLGQTIIPKVAFSGTSGGSSGQSFAVAPTGTPGTAGGSAYTGLLGAAGGAGQSLPFSGLGSTEEDPKNPGQKKAGQPGSDNASAISSLLGAAFPNLAIGPNGAATYGSVNPIQTPTTAVANDLVTPKTATALPTSTTGGNVDVNAMQQTQANNSLYKTNTAANTADDYTATLNEINNSYLKNKQAQDAQNPTPDNPMVYPDNQANAINESEDPFGLKQAVDQFKSTQTNLVQLETQRLDLQKNIQSFNDTLGTFFKNVKDNPDLPKGLAQRRLKSISDEYKPKIDSLNNTLSLLNTQIEDQNRVVDRQFQFIEFAANRQDKERELSQQKIENYYKSGTIASLSDAEIKSLSKTSGYSTSALKQMRDTAVNPNLVTSVEGSDETGRYLITYDKSNPSKVAKKLIIGPKVDTSAGLAANFGAISRSPDSSMSWIGTAATNIANSIYSKDQRATFTQSVGSAIKAGDTAGAKNIIETFAINKLSAGQKEDYTLNKKASAGMQLAAQSLATTPINFGPYKTVTEFLKPFVGQTKDQNYVAVKQAIELSQAALRKAQYGTSVTSTEKGNADLFLVNGNDDSKTVQTKLENGAKFLQWYNDATIAESTGTMAPRLGDYVQIGQNNQSGAIDSKGRPSLSNFEQ